jgi:hypothetical protein
MITKVVVLLLLIAPAAFAQVVWRPTDPPIVTAANESWYLLGEPIQFAGDVFYPAGPAVFFDGNVMARSGHYNGVPLYVDTTLEAFSVVFVPVRRGLMQPYERRRQGDIVGTTGSRTPAFPVALAPVPGRGITQAPSAPTQLPLPIGAAGAYTSEEPPASRPGTVVLESDEPIEPTYAPKPATAANLGAVTRGTGAAGPRLLTAAVLRQPQNNDGVWIQFRGRRWVSAGKAVPLNTSEFRNVGDYAGFPVFVRGARGTTIGDLIYLPTREDLVAPYRAK